MSRLFDAVVFNLVVVAMIIEGTFIIWSVVGMASLLWLVPSVFLLYYYLRKHLCTHCPYYGKVCYTGWGVLAAKMFPKEAGNFEKGKKVAPLAWMYFLIIPFIATIYVGKWTHTLIWAFGSTYLVVEHFRFCRRCPLREKCLSRNRLGK